MQTVEVGTELKSEQQFTLADVKKAIKLARIIKDKTCVFEVENISGFTEVCTYDWEVNMTEDEIINTLTQ